MLFNSCTPYCLKQFRKKSPLYAFYVTGMMVRLSVWYFRNLKIKEIEGSCTIHALLNLHFFICRNAVAEAIMLIQHKI